MKNRIHYKLNFLILMYMMACSRPTKPFVFLLNLINSTNLLLLYENKLAIGYKCVTHDNTNSTVCNPHSSSFVSEL